MGNKGISIARVWAMPSRNTFTIKPIKELLQRYNVGKGWIDPFCGNYSMAEFRNDLNGDVENAQYHMEAIDFLNLKDWDICGAIFDPPYSISCVAQFYNSIGIKGWRKNDKGCSFPMVRTRIAQLLHKGDICISFGWNTNGIGKKRGFEIDEILIVSHGGGRNDTLVTVEKKL